MARARERSRNESGQALLLLVAALAAAAVMAVVLGAVARGIGAHGREQRAADLGALAGARAMRDAYARLFEPPQIAGQPNPRHLERDAYEQLGRQAAAAVARSNGALDVRVFFPHPDPVAPLRIRVVAGGPVHVS